MEGALAAVVLVAFLIVGIAYNLWKRRAVKSQSFTSSADPDLIRDAFERKVATTGWKIVDDGNPMIAQSPLIAGIRQQVALNLTVDGAHVRGQYVTLRYVRKMLTGTPTKAVTLAARRSAFFKELARLNADPGRRHKNSVQTPPPAQIPTSLDRPLAAHRPAAVEPSPAEFAAGGTSPFAPRPEAPRPDPVAPLSTGSAQPWYLAGAGEAGEPSSSDPPVGTVNEEKTSDGDQWWAS